MIQRALFLRFRNDKRRRELKLTQQMIHPEKLSGKKRAIGIGRPAHNGARAKVCERAQNAKK